MLKSLLLLDSICQYFVKTCMFTRNISLQFSFVYCLCMVFDIKVIQVSKKELRSLFYFLEDIMQNLFHLFLNIWWISLVKPSGLKDFLVVCKSQIQFPNSYKAIKIIYSIMMNCGICFRGLGNLGCHFYVCRVVYRIYSFHPFNIYSLSSVSFLILVNCLLSSFFVSSQRFVNFIIIFEEPLLYFIDFSCCCLCVYY